MEMFGKTLCVTRNELVLGGIVSPATYDKYVNNGKFVVARRGCRSREALIIYEKLPDPIRNNYDTKNPKAKDKIKKQPINPMDSRLKSDSKAVDFYKRYTPKISLDRQAEYTLNAKVLNAMVALEMSMRDSQGKCGVQYNKMIREQVISLCESLRERYQHTLPKARLMEKYAAYKKYGYAVLVNGNAGNQSARKVGPKDAYC